jgi:hypothetical protein
MIEENCLIKTSSPNIIIMVKSRRMMWAEHVASLGEKRNACRIFVGKPEGKRPQGRSKERLEDNFIMDLQEIGWGGMNWIDLTQDREQWRDFMNMVMNLLHFYWEKSFGHI